MARAPWSAGAVKDERPDRPFTGFKLARAALSADGARTGFAGLTLGASQVYGVTADACCVWNHRHAAPRRWCGCGFYCLHDLADARSLGCATENRTALLLRVAASGRYIRYERGLRYSRQRVRAIVDVQCTCGRPGVALADAGSGLIGWRHLAPVCDICVRDKPALTLGEFAARLDGNVQVSSSRSSSPLTWKNTKQTGGSADARADSEESPIAILSAEIALLHARLDDLQSRLDQ